MTVHINPTAASRQESPTVSGAAPRKPGGTQAIDRAVSVLRCFGKGPIEYSLTELSHDLGLSPSTTHRIVRALLRRGFLAQNSETGGYRLGGIMALLAEGARHSFGLDRAVPILAEIAETHHDSVSLGVREGNMVGVLQRIESHRELRFSQAAGSQVMLHASAMGKAMLFGAADLDAEIAALGELPALTRNTITDRHALAAEITRSMARGYTIDDEEQVVGVRCIGMPIRDRKAHVRAAFAIQSPAALLDDERVHAIGKQMPGYAARLAEAMQL